MFNRSTSKAHARVAEKKKTPKTPLRPGPETSYLRAGELGGKITKDDADCWPCRRLDWRQSGSVPGVNILTTIGVILAGLKNRNGIDFLFLIDFMADRFGQSGKCKPRTNIIPTTFLQRRRRRARRSSVQVLIADSC